MNQKAVLRNKLRQRLDALDENDFMYAEQIVNSKLRSVVDWSAINNICLYGAQKSLREFSIESFCKWLLISQPHITVQLVSFDSNATLPDTQFDVIIMPALGYDENYNRLGRGSGWYDKFLHSQQSAVKIALAHSSQKVAKLPTEDHDQKVDRVITEISEQLTQ